MTQRFDRLVALLKELFQLDQPDLDFGFYRIMHAKSAEVTQFIERDLLPQVKAAFAQYRPADKAMIETELAKAIEQAQGLGADPETLPKVKELRARLVEDAVDLDALEAEVYDHLFGFFRRYYSEGDFLSKPVYKRGVYAIPYEGEEVKLHWANADQYYIKTSEYLRDYAFRLRPHDEKSPMRVHFRLVDAAEGEPGNVKEAAGKERRFRLAPETPAAIEEGELVIRFTYQPDPAKQKDLNAAAELAVLGLGNTVPAEWLHELGRNHVRADGTESEATRLRVHLDRYTARNIKVIRRIAGKIIGFLAQLEDFQKKLWLKRKFVVETSWYIRVGCIPEEFYPEIEANEAQREEWVKLCAIDEIDGDLTTPSYSVPLKVGFLKANPTLVVNTQHFDTDSVARLLEAIGNVDERTDGVLVNGENFQGLLLLRARYRERLGCIYIDPPYNTSENTFVYKNTYKHSSWLAMIQDRIRVAQHFLEAGGVHECAIDDTETSPLRGVLDSLFGSANRVASLAIEVNPAGQNLRPNTPALSHDYCHIYARAIDQMEMLSRELTEDERALYKGKDSKGAFLWDNLRRRGGNSRPTDRPGQWYPLYVDPDTKVVSVDAFDGAEEIWPIDPQGERRIWRTNPDGARREIAAGEISVIEKAGRLEVVKKTRMPEGKKPKTLWSDSRYSATTYGTKLLNHILGEQRFSYPKSLHLVADCLRFWCNDETQVLDYFAGSGTTGHAIITLNREDGGRRKFILVEVGDYFDTVLLPRLQKVTFTPEWKDGKPKRPATPEEVESSPCIMKVVRLESYEDTLNNLDLCRTDQQQGVLDLVQAQGPDKLREQYMLRYMLDVETGTSQSLLNIAAFTDPTAYRLQVKRPGSDESREVSVDLLETFNWLIGLTVQHIEAPRTFNATFKRDDDPSLPKDTPRRLLLDGSLEEDASGRWWFRTVTGTLPDGRKASVIWRKRPGGERPTGIEEDNLVLYEWFTQYYASKGGEFDVVYVNGTNNLGSAKAPDETWTLRLTEEDFHRLMFEIDER